MSGFFSELKRRRVYQSAAIYAVVAWGLAQVVDFVAERLFMPEWVSTVTAIVFVVGFPVTILLSWVFDIGPGGVRRTGVGSIKGLTSIVAAVVLLVGGTALLYAIVWPRHEVAQAEFVADANSIAVLPFSLLGQTSGNEYLSDGVAEEILYALSSLTDFRVAARTSSFSFKGQDKTVREISKVLGVRHIVEGSVRLNGDRLRVQVNLIRGDTGLQLWSQTYEQMAEDILGVQEDIAAMIADAVRVEMGGKVVGDRPRFRVQTENTEAYRLYLQGRFLWHQRGPENIRSAVAFFEQALEIEPDFAAAWAGLGSALLTSMTYRAGIANNFERAAEAARKAIELDDTLGEPYGPLAHLEMNARNYAEVERLIEKGIALAPQNTSLRLWHATYLLQFGRSLDASKQIELALARDPAYLILYANIGMSNYQMGNFEVSREYFEKAWQLGLRPYFLWVALYQIMIEQQDLGSAEAWFEELPSSRRPERDRLQELANRAWLAHERGQTAETRAVLDAAVLEYMQDPRSDGNEVVNMFASIGDVDAAFGVYRKMIDEGGYIDKATPWFPALAPLRKDLRMLEIFTELRLVEYWREVEWPDNCGPGEKDEVVCFR
jgi:TolB-like protein/Tfp pilus assembly protein PilF